MKHYAGLDVSLEETAICIIDGMGRIVKETRAESEPRALIAALSEIDLPLEPIGLEACSLTAWLHDELRSAGCPAVCIETRQANAAMKTMPNKTDRNDARALAQIMRTAGSGKSMSRAASPDCGARSWSRAARCSTKCARLRT
jgi:transposase